MIYSEYYIIYYLYSNINTYLFIYIEYLLVNQQTHTLEYLFGFPPAHLAFRSLENVETI